MYVKLHQSSLSLSHSRSKDHQAPKQVCHFLQIYILVPNFDSRFILPDEYIIFFHGIPKTHISIDSLQHIFFIELLTCAVYIDYLWHIIIWYVRMGDEVVDGTAPNTTHKKRLRQNYSCCDCMIYARKKVMTASVCHLEEGNWSMNSLAKFESSGVV